MGSICSQQLLEVCLRDGTWPRELLQASLAEEQGRALLRIVVERMGDLFEPRLGDVYARLITDAIAEIAPELLPRVRRARGDARWPADADRVYVLSRITLGADVAVTSVLMNAAKRRYPEAQIIFVGPRKNYELFEADPRVTHSPAPYARDGSLRERLAASASLWIDDGIVIDPDSRLTQLGMVQVCPEDRYMFFESRAYDGDGRLPDLAARWAGDPQAKPCIAPLPPTGDAFDITVSLGVGENPAKRLGDDFELALLQAIAETGYSVLVDLGGSEEERARVQRALQPGMRTHNGAFAPFAAQIARSKLFLGYDSAAGHVASACGVPLISIAAGFVNDRMAARWRPLGTAIAGDSPDPLGAVRAALATYTSRR